MNNNNIVTNKTRVWVLILITIFIYMHIYFFKFKDEKFLGYIDIKKNPILISGSDSGSGFAPSFIEKPRIIPNESGTLITLRCNCTANPKPEVTWYKGTKLVTETSKISMKVTGQENTYEILLLIQVIFMFFSRYNTS